MAKLRSWKSVLLILVLALLAWLVMDFNHRMAELNRLTGDRAYVSTQLGQQMQTQSYLLTEIAYATSEPAVEKWAYEQGHMSKPGDNPVIPLPAGQVAPTPTPEVQATPTKTSHWQAWMLLFFGPRTP
jgi:hypothetical protein